MKDAGSGKWSRSGQPTLLVNYASATCGRGWDTDDDHKTSIDADHSGMVKFSESDHDGYPKVRDILRDFASHADEIIKTRMHPRSSRSS